MKTFIMTLRNNFQTCSFRIPISLRHLMVFLLTIFSVQMGLACDCDVAPNNQNQTVNVLDVVLGANKSYSSFCGPYYLEFEVIPISDPYTGTVTHTGGTLIDVGAVPLPPVTILYSSLLPSTTYKWRVRQWGGLLPHLVLLIT